MFARVWALVFVRIIFALYALAMLIWGMIVLNGRYPTNGYSPSPWWSWGIYLGHWSFFSLLIYYMAASYFTIREIRTGAFGPLNCGEKWMWINYQIAWAAMWSCCLLFWLVPASNCTFSKDCSAITWYEYNVYAIALGTILIEFLFNLMRWKWLHFIFPLIFLFTYFVFAAIWHSSTNVWPHDQQDPNIVGGGVSFGFYALLIVCFVFFHFCGFGCAWVTEKCYKGKARKKDGDMLGDDPVNISDMCC